MKKLLEILRLYFENQLSEREISKLVNVAKTTVHNYIILFNKSSLSWPLSSEYLDEKVLSEKLKPNYNTADKYKLDFAMVHKELKSDKKVTLHLLWEDYKIRDDMTYSYAHFTRLYNQWLAKQPNVMRQNHKAGEKVFVDYSGDRVPIYDKHGIVIFYAEIFIGVLGASNYIYLEATKSQKLEDWNMSHVRMFKHFGGTPKLIISDNLKSAVSKPNRYDPVITPAYYDMLSHYKTAAMPARVYTPKDKAKVENGVLIIQRWILAKLRNRKFINLKDLNQQLTEYMSIANNKQLQGYPYTRKELFEQIDQPVLIALPAHDYCYRAYKKVMIGNDYHFKLDHHHYSVPYSLVSEEVDIWYTNNLV